MTRPPLNAHNEPVSCTTLYDDIERIRRLCQSIEEPKVPYQSNQLDMAHAVIAHNQDAARQVLQILRPFCN